VAADYQCWIVDRGLKRKLHQLPFTSLQWERVQDDSSRATVAVPTDSALSLRGARPWRHGIGVFRSGKMEWIGPIVTIARPIDSETVTVTARDKLAWTFKRFVRATIDYENADLGHYFDLLIAEATKRDNAFNLSSSTPNTRVAGKRSYLGSSDSQVFSGIQELARTGLDFTVWRDELLSGPTNELFTGHLLVGADAFLGQIGVELDGMDQGNSHRTAAGGTGGSDGFTIIGEYEDLGDGAYGVLETFETEALIKDANSAEAASRLRWDELHETPQAVSFPPLGPLFPGTLDDCIPGKLWRIQVDDPLFDISGNYRLVSLDVRVSVGGGGEIEETIQPELQDVSR
jgi:hypothetical protein